MLSLDLHPYFDPLRASIRFWMCIGGRIRDVELDRDTVSSHFAVPDTQYGMIVTYDANRAQIDAAVMRRAARGGKGVLHVGAEDFESALPMRH